MLNSYGDATITGEGQQFFSKPQRLRSGLERLASQAEVFVFLSQPRQT